MSKIPEPSVSAVLARVLLRVIACEETPGRLGEGDATTPKPDKSISVIAPATVPSDADEKSGEGLDFGLGLGVGVGEG